MVILSGESSCQELGKGESQDSYCRETKFAAECAFVVIIVPVACFCEAV